MLRRSISSITRTAWSRRPPLLRQPKWLMLALLAVRAVALTTAQAHTQSLPLHGLVVLQRLVLVTRSFQFRSLASPRRPLQRSTLMAPRTLLALACKLSPARLLSSCRLPTLMTRLLCPTTQQLAQRTSTTPLLSKTSQLRLRAQRTLFRSIFRAQAVQFLSWEPLVMILKIQPTTLRGRLLEMRRSEAARAQPLVTTSAFTLVRFRCLRHIVTTTAQRPVTVPTCAPSPKVGCSSCPAQPMCMRTRPQETSLVRLLVAQR